MPQINPRNPDGSPSVIMRWWEMIIAVLYLAGLIGGAVYGVGEICKAMGQCV